MSDQQGASEPELNAAAIVAALNRHQVRYVIIGAFAAIAQKAPIPATRDIDLTRKMNLSWVRGSTRRSAAEPGEG